MNRVLLDSNIFLHALGKDEALRHSCAEIIDQLAAGAFVGEAACLLVNEVVHVRHRRSGDRRRAVLDGRAAAQLLVLRTVDDVDTITALELFLSHERLQMNDAVQVAVARRYGLVTVLSTDRGLDGIPGLRRIDPVDREAVAQLIAG